MNITWKSLAWRTGFSASLFYIFFFSVTAFQLFNMTDWLGTRGVDPATAGRIQGSADLFFVVGILLAGLLADWQGFNRRLYLVYFCIAVLGYIFLGLTAQTWALGVALALISFAFIPLTNLVDAHLQPYVSRDLIPYARVRALGSISFTLIILFTATLSEERIMMLFYPVIAFFVLAVGFSLAALPPQPRHIPAPILEKFFTFGRLLSQPRFIAFYAIIMLIHGSHGAYYIYAVPIWREWGFGSGQIYSLIGWGVVAEIIFFLIAPKALTDSRAAPLLALCSIAAITRWLMWPHVDGWVGLIFVQSLHVLTFALTHLISLAFLRRRVPEAELGAAQALMPAISVGIGMGSAKLLAAQYIGESQVTPFVAMALMVALSLPLCLILHKLSGVRTESIST